MGEPLADRQRPRPFLLTPTASAFPSGLTLDALMFGALAAVFAAIAAAAVRAVVAFVASVACASVRAADFSLRLRSASCIADAPYLVAAGVFAAVDLASSTNLPAASDTSDLPSYSPYSELPDADTRVDLSDALDCSRVLSPPGWFRPSAPLRAR